MGKHSARRRLTARSAWPIAITVMLGMALLLGPAAAQDAGLPGDLVSSGGRPNIVFILTDDQAESTLKHMPNVQSLLKGEGRIFENAVNVYPLCCPSRAVIQRGQYAHNVGVFGNEPKRGGGYPVFDELDREKSTLATWLHDAGYRTAHFGKYMNGFYGPPPPGWDVFGQPTVPYEEGAVFDATLANRAMAQLKEEVPKAEPFFLQVGFIAPHTPNVFEPRYADMFSGARVPRVPSFDERNVSDKPRYIREDKPRLSRQNNPTVHRLCKDNEDNSIEQNDCEYLRQLRALQTVDAFVKDLTDHLAAQGELDNTYILYYTDNGNHWGEHRLDYGKLTPYETDTGFPLLIRGPSIPAGTTSNDLVGNHDIAPTLAGVAGADVPDFVDGRDFLPVADADSANDDPWRTAIYIQRRWKKGWSLPPTSSPQYVPPYEAVRTESSIYVRYNDDPWTARHDPGFEEFYDLRTDPHQLRNLVHYREVRRGVLDRTHQRLLALRGCVGESCRTAEMR